MKHATQILPALITILLSLSAALPSQALTDGVRKLVEMETQANAVSKRDPTARSLPHVEIPLEFVGVDFAQRIDPLIASSLIFERDGKKYVRWILNPEDTKWGAELIQYFAQKGLALELKHHFIGYQTASRSYIAEDPATGAQFSVKSSTNNTGGAWKDKKQPIGEAIDGRLLSDFLAEQNRKKPFENFIFMEEPAILKISDLDQAVVIRDLGPLKLPSNHKTYLPGFSALHDKVGADIARKNGSNDPFKFWTENYIDVAGRALGEMAARTGLQFDSPHSQNFLIELDSNDKPTGRLVLRDMSDLYLDVSFIRALQGNDSKILKNFTQKENMLPAIAAGFGPLHGNSKPSWVSEAQYSQWLQHFFLQFEQTFKKVSGYDLRLNKNRKVQSRDYFTARYSLASDPQFDGLYQAMRAEGVVRNHQTPVRCDHLHSVSGF